MSERFASHDPGRGDTAGTPWRGRTLPAGMPDQDAGGADPALIAAVARPQEEAELVAAVARARLLVPIVAMPGAQASSDMAAVTLTAPDGQRALPMFSSVSAMGDWDGRARPVPVSAQRAAVAAVQEGCALLVLDPGSPRSVTLRGSMMWALAQARQWQPAYQEPLVRAAVESAVTGEPNVAAACARPGEHGALLVELAVTAGLDRDAVDELVRRVGERVASDEDVRARIDSMRFRLRTA